MSIRPEEKFQFFSSCASLAPCTPSFKDLDCDFCWVENPHSPLHFSFFYLAWCLMHSRFKLSSGCLYFVHTILQRGLPVRWLCNIYDSLLYNFAHVPLVKTKSSRTQTWRPKISFWCPPHFPMTVMTVLKDRKKGKKTKQLYQLGSRRTKPTMDSQFWYMFWKGTVLFYNWIMMSSWKQFFLPQHSWVMSTESWERLSHKGERTLDIVALVTSQMWEAFVLVQPQKASRLMVSRMWSTILVMKVN